MLHRLVLRVFGVFACTFGAYALRLQAQDSSDPELTIEAGGRKAAFKRSELLARPDLETIEVAADPTYPGRKMTYQAIRAAKLFGDALPAQTVILFHCLDGFSAPIDKARLLNTDPKASQAYIAIEPAGAPWPKVKPDGPSAGPYYLVWPEPKLSHIGPEEWPFQLTGFTVQEDLKQLYPAIFPGPDASAQVQRGFAAFTKNCFPCHTINRAGAADVGPDLNVPWNPTEYLQKGALRRLVRNPQDLRYFPRSRMSPFPKSALPDKNLNELIAYLTYMAKHKAVAKAP